MESLITGLMSNPEHAALGISLLWGLLERRGRQEDARRHVDAVGRYIDVLKSTQAMLERFLPK